MKYIEELIEIYRKNENLKNKTDMEKYMRNKFIFFGIKSPLRKKISKPFLINKNLPKNSELKNIIEELWDLNEREYQYFAIELLRKKANELNEFHLKYIEKLIVKKSWWDSIDGLASNIIGVIFKNHCNLRDKYSRKWMDSKNIWLQRTIILFQLTYKNNTDSDFLFKNIIELKDSEEFFIQKAIGWSLRQYSKIEKDKVLDFINKTDLKPLSKREGLKWIKSKFGNFSFQNLQ
jgi:3-methyladenine DNA glycosylase AlkD